MKKIKIFGSVLSLIALLLCAWPLLELMGEDSDLVGSTINLIYFSTLFVALFCFRISLGYSNRVNPIIALLSIGLIVSSTYTWMFPSELLVLGKITLGIIPLLLGTTLMLIVKENSKWSKIVQLLIGIIAVILASCVFLGVSETLIYIFAFIGLAIASIAVVAYLIFARSN